MIAKLSRYVAATSLVAIGALKLLTDRPAEDPFIDLLRSPIIYRSLAIGLIALGLFMFSRGSPGRLALHVASLFLLAGGVALGIAAMSGRDVQLCGCFGGSQVPYYAHALITVVLYACVQLGFRDAG